MSTALVPATTAAPVTLYVVFRVGDVDYALPANAVLQMESFTGATAVPGARAFVIGIIQLRGRVVPVIDLRLRFGLPASVPTLDSRVVVVESQGRAVALLADVAREVVRVAEDEAKAPPRLVDDGGFVNAVIQRPARTFLVLDLAKVIGQESLDV